MIDFEDKIVSLVKHFGDEVMNAINASTTTRIAQTFPMAGTHTDERTLNRQFVDALRECLGMAPLYRPDRSASHRAAWIARYGRGWAYVGKGATPEDY